MKEIKFFAPESFVKKIEEGRKNMKCSFSWFMRDLIDIGLKNREIQILKNKGE
jgi:hypothetical protein